MIKYQRPSRVFDSFQRLAARGFRKHQPPGQWLPTRSAVAGLWWPAAFGFRLLGQWIPVHLSAFPEASYHGATDLLVVQARHKWMLCLLYRRQSPYYSFSGIALPQTAFFTEFTVTSCLTQITVLFIPCLAPDISMEGSAFLNEKNLSPFLFRVFPSIGPKALWRSEENISWVTCLWQITISLFFLFTHKKLRLLQSSHSASFIIIISGNNVGSDKIAATSDYLRLHGSLRDHNREAVVCGFRQGSHHYRKLWLLSFKSRLDFSRDRLRLCQKW